MRNLCALRAAAGAIAALALALGMSGAGAAARAEGPASFVDAAGDSQGAPDITAVTVRDDASGVITFAVTVAGLLPVSDVEIYIDTDKNLATGSPSGAEYLLVVWVDTDDWGWDVAHWAGTDWMESPQTSSMGLSRSGDVSTWTVSKTDLGGATGFAFRVASFAADSSGNVTASDLAPDAGRWSYDLTPAGPTVAVARPVIGKPRVAPAHPAAGKQFSVTFPVTRSDTGAPLASGTMVCDPSIAGRVIPHTERLENGNAKLVFVIPKTAKGKLLKVTVTIKAHGRSATRVATFRVR